MIILTDYPLLFIVSSLVPCLCLLFTYLHVPRQAEQSIEKIDGMGQLMEKDKRQERFSLTSPIRIIALEAKIDSQSTIMDEKSSTVFKYRTPYFRAIATIEFPPLDHHEHWKIGWIQACTRMDFINNYGDQGYSSWEIPQLISGETTMISDADGRNYPFYGSNSELIELYGPSADYRRIQVRMNDNFYPHITWDIPTSNERVSRLTHVRREQHFYTWLVAMNAHNGSILVLKTIQWQMNLEIDVNPKQIQGSRAKLISNPIPIQPIILKDNVRIPSTVLYPPNANSAQILVWHPKRINALPEIVVPPRYPSILDRNPYYEHYLRHKTESSLQNKLNNGGHSHNKPKKKQTSYTRVIHPVQSSCSTDMTHLIDDHARLAQGILVR